MQRGGTLAKRVGRAQDINANNIKQTACALVLLVCQQLQSKFVRHRCKEFEPGLGLAARRERVGLAYLFVTTTAFRAVSHSSNKACYVQCNGVALLPNVPEGHRTSSTQTTLQTKSWQRNVYVQVCHKIPLQTAEF